MRLLFEDFTLHLSFYGIKCYFSTIKLWGGPKGDFFFTERSGKMKNKSKYALVVMLLLLAVGNVASATIDTFGTGANQFTINFVNISGDASSANGTNISQYSPGELGYKTFTDPGDYRIGVYEITNEQWNKFTNIYGTPTGSLSNAYGESAYFTGTDVPVNNVSWFEAVQFVNWLNTSTGHQAAYKFTGTQGTSDYTFVPWDVTDTGYDASNPYRNSNAFYFLPTEDEWVKAAYWNGTSLQTYATKPGDTLYQGNGSNGGWNYLDGEYATDPYGPWDVGSGSEELNGTFEMMGNVWEWNETLNYDTWRGQRGGSYGFVEFNMKSSSRSYENPAGQIGSVGFRVASIPEPATLLLFGLGYLFLKKRV